MNWLQRKRCSFVLLLGVFFVLIVAKSKSTNNKKLLEVKKTVHLLPQLDVILAATGNVYYDVTFYKKRMYRNNIRYMLSRRGSSKDRLGRLSVQSFMQLVYAMTANDFVKFNEKLMNFSDLSLLYNGHSILHEAVLKGSAQMIDALLRKDIKILEEPTYDGKTALHLAVLGGLMDKVMVLLIYGANINALSKINNTPLHLAVISGEFQIAKLLVEGFFSSAGAIIEADQSIQNSFGMTPLMAVFTQENNIVDSDNAMLRLLLQYSGDSLFLRDENGEGIVEWVVGSESIINFSIVKEYILDNREALKMRQPVDFLADISDALIIADAIHNQFIKEYMKSSLCELKAVY